jgi:Zn-dependent protease
MSNNRKVYESFYDVPFSNQYGYGSQPQSTLRFSKTELIHLGISVAVLTIAFSFAFVPIRSSAFSIASFLTVLPQSFLAIITAFVFHELAHKYMGQKYGFWSEFRMFPQGLLLALVFGVLAGIVFAAPGAVQIYGSPGRKEYGHISLAGPSTNMVIALIFLSLGFVFTGAISFTLFFIGYINIFLALFNLLPFGPLDGRKVMSWRFDVWLVFFIGALVIFGVFLTGAPF